MRQPPLTAARDWCGHSVSRVNLSFPLGQKFDVHPEIVSRALFGSGYAGLGKGYPERNLDFTACSTPVDIETFAVLHHTKEFWRRSMQEGDEAVKNSKPINLTQIGRAHV